MKYPIKVLMDKDKKPFIPFVPTSAIVENGTGKTLEEILANLAVPIVNLTSLDNDTVAAMMTKMYNYKDIGFDVIYTDANGASKVYSYVKQAVADTLNKTWTFTSPAEPLQFTLNISGYYNTDTSVFTVSSVELINTYGVFNNAYFINADIDSARPLWISNKTKLKPWTAFIQWAFNNQIHYPVFYLTGGDGVTEPWCMDSDIDNFDSTWATSLTFRNRDVGKTAKQYITMRISWSNGVPSVSQVYISRNTAYSYLNTNTGLSKTNTTLYTPSKDYHPATKKYVDDSVSTIDLSAYATNEYVDERLGDINAILATLTTPEVGE